MQTPTAPEHKATINRVFRSAEKTMSYLYCRWQDEKEYEDIADYAKPIRPLLPAGMNFRRMTKRPFGFEFDIGTDAVYSVFVNAKQYGWKRIS